MPPKAGGTKAERAQRAKEKKDRKLLEQQIKNSREKVEEGRVFLFPVEPKKQPDQNKAIASFDAAIELHSENFEAFALRADSNRDLRQWEKAIDDYTMAANLSGNQHVPALEGRSTCYKALRLWDKSIADLTSVVELQPHNDHAHNLRGTVRLLKRAPGLRLSNADFAAVVEDLQTAIRLNENNYYAQCNLARCYDEHKMYPDAITHYTRAMQLKDEYTHAGYRRGCCALQFVEDQRVAARIAAAKSAAKLEAMIKAGIELPADERSIDEMIADEHLAAKAAAQERDLLNQAIKDFDRTIPEEKVTELPSVVHRGSCYLMLDKIDLCDEDFKFADKTLKAVPQVELAETMFSGTRAILLVDVLAIKMEVLNGLKAKRDELKSRRMTTLE
jgi:tetratricopeptide (TPR) repeat protein